MSETKSTVYVETTVIGHLTGRIVTDPIVAGRQLATRAWWSEAPSRHRLLISELVVDECSAGDPAAASERLLAIDGIEEVHSTPEIQDFASRLIASFAIPSTEPRDALHIALAASNSVEFLATSNFKHIANAANRRKIERVCREAGFVPPTICTPQELWEPYRET